MVKRSNMTQEWIQKHIDDVLEQRISDELKRELAYMFWVSGNNLSGIDYVLGLLNSEFSMASAQSN